MVKWSKSLVKILICRNVSTFHHVEKSGNTLKSDNVVVFDKALKLDPVVEIGKRFSKLCTCSIFLVTLCHRV